MDANGLLIERAQGLLADVTFLNYKFVVKEGHGGVKMYATYMDADIYTGKIEEQTTRKWELTPFMTDSEIVQTAFLCCNKSFEHRCREAFVFQGSRIFGPHFDVFDLVKLCKDGKENAGGRKL